MIEWQENLSIGVLDIDIQHKLLFEKFNAFLHACQEEPESDNVHRLFWFLEAYTVTHFKEEEKLMQRLGFPEYLTHRERHREFASEVGRLKERLRIEGPTQSLVASMTMFISGWLIRHISSMDWAIGQFAKNRLTLPSGHVVGDLVVPHKKLQSE
jgi:hemerythrin